MLEVIDQLVVGNRVSLKWFWDDHLRIEEIEVIMPEWEGELFEGYVLKSEINGWMYRTKMKVCHGDFIYHG